MEKFQNLIQAEKPVLVDFSAEWCAPCKMLHPILKQVKDSLGDQVKIVKIDVDQNRELAMQYRIQSVPTLMLFQKGEMKWKGMGVMQAKQLESTILSNVEPS